MEKNMQTTILSLLYRGYVEDDGKEKCTLLFYFCYIVVI